MFAGAFAGKTAFITGHTGFKGAWLALWLERLGARVVGYSLPPPTTPSLFQACGLAGRLEHIEADVRDRERLRQAITRSRPDFIFHLAAHTLVRESYANPLATYEVNLMGTLSLLEAVRGLSHPCAVVIISTDKCYENREWPYGYRETDALGGHDPYSASKAAMEIAVASYRRAYFPPSPSDAHGVGLATARAGNVIGGGDWAKDRLVPDAMRALSQGEPLILRNPAAVRPWQHVLEPLSGYLWLAARLAAAGAAFASGWNFGPPVTDTYTVAELADALVKAWGAGDWQASEIANAPHEAGRLLLAIDKARSQLGWQPVWDFHSAVERAVAWYRAFYAEPADDRMACDLCLADLDNYERAAAAKGLRWTV